MTDMIDRGARAILDCAQGQTWAFTEQKPLDLTNVMLDGQFNLVEFAAAVIAAIREPTKAMVITGDNHTPTRGQPRNGIGTGKQGETGVSYPMLLSISDWNDVTLELLESSDGSGRLWIRISSERTGDAMGFGLTQVSVEFLEAALHAGSRRLAAAPTSAQDAGTPPAEPTDPAKP